MGPDPCHSDRLHPGSDHAPFRVTESHAVVYGKHSDHGVTKWGSSRMRSECRR